MDKVRRIAHPKLRVFHFQIKTYYLPDANYPTDNPSLVWIQPVINKDINKQELITVTIKFTIFDSFTKN